MQILKAKFFQHSIAENVNNAMDVPQIKAAKQACTLQGHIFGSIHLKQPTLHNVRVKLLCMRRYKCGVCHEWYEHNQGCIYVILHTCSNCNELQFHTTNPSHSWQIPMHQQMICLIIKSPLTDNQGCTNILHLINATNEIHAWTKKGK